MDGTINLAEKLVLLDKPYVPGIVGYINDYKLQVVMVKGPFVWHKHDETDDFFLVISGRLTIHLRDRDVVLDPGEIFVVPRGVEHCPDADEEIRCCEPDGTVNTGDAGGGMTLSRSSSETGPLGQGESWRGWQDAGARGGRPSDWRSAVPGILHPQPDPAVIGAGVAANGRHEVHARAAGRPRFPSPALEGGGPLCIAVTTQTLRGPRGLGHRSAIETGRG